MKGFLDRPYLVSINITRKICLLTALLFIPETRVFLQDQFPPFSKIKAPYNFGLVIANGQYTMYRSSMLGKKGLEKLFRYLKQKSWPLPKTIIYMNKEGYKRNFPFFQEGALEEYDLQKRYGYQFFHSFDQQYRTYVDGNNPYFPTDDIDSTKNLGKKAIKLFGLNKEKKKDGDVSSVLRILKLVLNKDNHPVLFHCYGGRHRTGMIGMTIRYLQGGYWVNGPKRKIFVLPSFKVLELNPAEYEYALHNRELFRMKNIQFIRKFAQSEDFLALQQLHREDLQENHLEREEMVNDLYSQDEGDVLSIGGNQPLSVYENAGRVD
jgi:hypothetical protein